MFGTFVIAGQDKQGREVRLAPPTQELTPYLVEWRNDPQVMRYYDQHYDPSTPTDYDYNAMWLNLVGRSSLAIFWTIMVDDQPVGTALIDYMYEGNGIYAIMVGAQDYWGAGIGTLATQAVVHYGFSEHYLTDTLRTTVLNSNAASVNMLRKASFDLRQVENARWLAELNYTRWQQSYLSMRYDAAKERFPDAR